MLTDPCQAGLGSNSSARNSPKLGYSQFGQGGPSPTNLLVRLWARSRAVVTNRGQNMAWLGQSYSNVAHTRAPRTSCKPLYWSCGQLWILPGSPEIASRTRGAPTLPSGNMFVLPSLSLSVRFGLPKAAVDVVRQACSVYGGSVTGMHRQAVCSGLSEGVSSRGFPESCPKPGFEMVLARGAQGRPHRQNFARGTDFRRAPSLERPHKRPELRTTPARGFGRFPGDPPPRWTPSGCPGELRLVTPAALERPMMAERAARPETCRDSARNAPRTVTPRRTRRASVGRSDSVPVRASSAQGGHS